MTRKPFAAFGRILYANYYEKGEVFNLTTIANSRTVLFFSSGDVVARDRDTGEVAYSCKPGFFVYGGHKSSNLECVVNEPAVCWCYDPLVNQGFVPTIETFIMIRDQRALIDIHTNLFLCDGSLVIKENTYTGPYQLAMNNEKKVILASSDVYGLIFK